MDVRLRESMTFEAEEDDDDEGVEEERKKREAGHGRMALEGHSGVHLVAFVGGQADDAGDVGAGFIGNGSCHHGDCVMKRRLGYGYPQSAFVFKSCPSQI